MVASHHGWLSAALAAAAVVAPATVRAADPVELGGFVTDSVKKEPVAGAIVIVQCTCLQGERQVLTNSDGAYAFRDLPPGTYTVQAAAGEALFNKIVELGPGKRRLDFDMNPGQGFVTDVVVEAPVKTGGGTVIKLRPEEYGRTGAGGTDRSYTALVDVAPTVTADAGGLRIAGTSSSESRYTLDNANINTPAFGNLSTTIVQEFISDVEVHEAGYDAEYGGAAGGQVRARRIGGNNDFRGTILMRVAPRLAPPRFISATDEALRVAEIAEVDAQAVIQVSGPIVKDRLFFSIGVAPGGQRNTLIQSFFRRRDKDRSGGYEACPYENGTNDCAAAGNYIDTVKFAEQRFRTGRVDLQWSGTLDWQITPKHRLRLGGGSSPVSLRRTAFRLPPGAEPSAFGTNPAAQIGGSSRVAQGVVNDSLGTNLLHVSGASLDYQGRTARDSLEIDATLYYSRYRGVDAWKLDDPGLKDQPLVQRTDTQGINLYKLLDREGATSLVPGVDEACNDSKLPGLTCPTRTWLSGGIGNYSTYVQDRVGGLLSFTHFLGTRRAGAHQIKYGTEIEGVRFRQVSAYSGSNDPSFYRNCPAGQLGGGEYCYDPATDQYTLHTVGRVDNHRAVNISADNPDQRNTLGYGRVRAEQDDLRAISTAIGAGVRVPAYDATLTTQNYAVYLQDRWQLLSNLYLHAGVRWEMQDMRDLLGRRNVFIWDNVGPRLGLSYDWTDEGKSRLYAGYGWFFNQLPVLLNSRAFGGLINVQRTYRNSDCVTPAPGGQSRSDAAELPTEYCTDANTSTSGLTSGSVAPRLKGMYTQQFQVGYEQEILEDLVVGVHWVHQDLARVVEDISTNGGLNYLIANPGEDVSRKDLARQADKCADLQQQFDDAADGAPERDSLAREVNHCNFLLDAFRRVGDDFVRPTRNYDAWTLRVNKRFGRNWLLAASYTYSRLIGNYDGFVARNTGAINLGASTQYDLPDLIRNSFGPLFDNRPHVAKLDAFYTFDLRKSGRLTLGGSLRYQSGTPISLYVDHNRYRGQFLTYVLPRGSGGRLEPQYFANISVSYAYPLPRGLELEFTARLANLTNAKAVLRVDEVYSFSLSRAIAGGDHVDLQHAKTQNPNAPTQFFRRDVVPRQGNFGVQTVFQQPVQAQFELRLRF
ncbi:MAG: TonB-dependent receptor [Myxococcales bacterium]|nr:TonB-dependent receptor [Myxococcales bacterium]